MCGFLTEFTFQHSKLTDAKLFAQLLQLSKHRGPDSTLIHSQKNYQLGFNRLAILDVSDKGNQPKYSPSKRYHVAFNGEIYNFKDLENYYKLSNLQSTSDTEVLTHLLDKIGVEKTLKKLNGMFAIAIIDTQKNDLYLARDFAGIKPLFYGISNQGVVAASQFNQVFKHPWFKNDLVLRPNIMKEYFGFGYMQAPNTIYETIFQVNPGEFIKITNKAEIEKFNFKRFNLEWQTTSKEKNNIEKIEQCLSASVKRQLVSDVPLASFLSGGIDSPIITAMAKKEASNIEAFTIAVEGKELDESKIASNYAHHLKIKHYIHNIKEEDLIQSIDNHFKNLPEPFGDYSSIPTYLITKKAREDNTVMLSGDGGDELFFGYPRMLDILNKRYWFKIPFTIRKPLVRILNKINCIDTWAPYHYKKIGEWIKAKHLHIFKNELDGFFSDSQFSKEMEALYSFGETQNVTELLKQLRYNEFYGHLQRVLIKVDRMSMANSMEVRVPFLDKKFIELAMNIEPEVLRSQKALKKQLKDIMLNYYPQTLINNTKKGFAVPIEKWLRKELRQDVKKVIFDIPFYGASNINMDAIYKYVNDFFEEKHNSGWGIWHIYAWQKWAISQGLI